MKEEKSISEIRQLIEEIYKKDEELNKQVYPSKKLRAAYRAGIWEGLLYYYDITFRKEQEKLEYVNQVQNS
jgi:hypothetical protein